MSFTTDALANIGNRQISTPAGVLSQSMSPTIDANGVVRYKNVNNLDTTTSFGLGAVAQFDGSAAFGAYAVAVDRAAIAIGPYSKAQGNSSIAIGEQTVANRALSIAIGPRNLANTPYSIVIGMMAKATVGLLGLGGQIVIGYRASSAGDDAIAIGELSQADGDFSIAIGSQARTGNGGAAGTFPIAIGNFSLASGEGIALGTTASAGINFNIAIGSGAVSGQVNSIAIGRASTTTENSQMLIGCATFPINLAVSGKIKLYNNATPVDGQLIIGKTATNTFEAATLTAGSGIAITNGAGSITIAATATTSKVLPLFDHYADAGNGTTVETDFYSDVTAAGQLASNGDKIEAEYAGTFVSSATATRQIRIYFGGTSVFDTGALTLSLSSAWTCFITIIRVDANTVHYMVSFTTEGAALAAYTATGSLGGLTLSNTNILKITGQAAAVGAATNDIVAKMGDVRWTSHA